MIVYIYFYCELSPNTSAGKGKQNCKKKSSYLHISELFKTKKAWEQSNIIIKFVPEPQIPSIIHEISVLIFFYADA